MELLRIIAMLLVMVVHADGRALHFPTVIEVNDAPCSSFLRYLTESFSIVCVDTFVLLSGWFGIHLKLKRLSELLFQIFFFSVVCVAFYVLFSAKKVSLTDALYHIFILDKGDYWFIKCYLGLYILSPVLNAFVEKVTQKEYASFLIIFFVFQTVLGWCSNSASYIEYGYSAFSFMGLYLLARYVRLYPYKWSVMPRRFDLLVYLIVVCILTASAFLFRYNNVKYDGTFLYTNPLVIIASLHLLLFFSKMRLTSRFVNWIAVSSFAIYLVHSNHYIYLDYYDAVIKGWFDSLTRCPFILCTTLLIAVVFIISILTDKVRILIWKRLIKE